MNQILVYLSVSDRWLAGRLTSWHAPRWFRLWMLWATRLGDGWIWVATGLLLVAWGGRAWHALALGTVAAGVGNLTQVLVKPLVRRPRPCEHGPGAEYRCCRGYSDSLLAFDEFSFPSGHAINAFAIGTALSVALPVLLPLALVAAISIAASRVMLGMHFVSDVVAGAAIGVLIGASTLLLLG